jgi:carbonic anhydrase
VGPQVSFRDEALEANAAYAAGFPAGERSAPPTRRVAVLACMDARLRPEDALGLALGEAHVIRNAGGRVTDDAVRSLMLSSAVLGTRRVAVIHHTDCGLLGATDEALRDQVVAATGERVDDVEFLAFDDAEAALLDDVRAIEQDPRLPIDEVSGFLYDVGTGRLRLVTLSPPG